MSTMSQRSESITLEELADHSTLESLWIAVHGQVYDLTTFSADHPGGIDVLESCAGTDGTESYDYAGHSAANMAKMQQYRVGHLAGSQEPVSPVSLPPRPAQSERAPARARAWGFPGWRKGVTIAAASLVMALSYQRRDDVVEYLSLSIELSSLRSRLAADSSVGHAFWAGIVVASSASCLGFRYLYKLFVSTLDYQNDVFSFPPTIPRKRKR